MRVVSVNVGGPQEIEWNGKSVLTSIFKTPVNGSVPVRKHNLDGDRQSDLTVHGGRDKAVYGYASEHYAFWEHELGDTPLEWGRFGENLTTEGIDDAELSVGDVVQIGTAVLMVTQPRIPCFKLALRFGRSDMVKRFSAARRPGFYFAVVEPGEVAAGDSIEIVDRAIERMSVRDLFDLFFSKTPDSTVLARALELRGLAEDWSREIRKLLAGTKTAARE